MCNWHLPFPAAQLLCPAAGILQGIEPCGVPFRRLIAAAITSESRLLRAAIVRVCAKAAGEAGLLWRAGC